MKRLHDVAVRMRPRVPRAPDGAPIVPAEGDAARPDLPDLPARDAAQETGFSKRGDAPRIPARAPFMPSSRDLARLGTDAAEDTTPSDPPGTARPSADMTKSDDRGDRPVSVPRRQIWDLEPDEVEAMASHAVVTDRTYLPDLPEDGSPDRGPSRGPARTDADKIATHIADEADAADDESDEDMAGRALRALQAAERQLEARGIPASALYAGEAAKTRVLGFHGTGLETDAISAVARKSAGDVRFPAGWIVVVDGPGRGAYFAVTNSVSSIGRGLDQAICLNFGDASISRNNHAAIAYDAEQNRFFLGHGNKSNIVRRNGMPVLATEELNDGDEIRIGKTTLRFAALCGPRFTWGPEPQEEVDDA